MLENFLAQTSIRASDNDCLRRERDGRLRNPEQELGMDKTAESRHCVWSVTGAFVGEHRDGPKWSLSLGCARIPIIIYLSQRDSCAMEMSGIDSSPRIYGDAYRHNLEWNQ